MSESEKWKPISGLEEKYEVSNMGRVKSLDRVLTTKRGHQQRANGTELRPRTFKRAPNGVRIRIDGKDCVLRICELVAKEFIPNPDGLPNVVHINGDIHDDRASNLAWSEEPDFEGMKDWGGLAALDHRLYNIWKCMILRCEDESRSFYHRYGGRGIKVCDEWHDLKVFADWAYSNGYQDGLSIDRIDNDGNYRPDNCRWVSKQEQSLNKSTNVSICVRGTSLVAKQWADKLGISKYTVYDWVRVHGKSYASRRIEEKLTHCGAELEDE